MAARAMVFGKLPRHGDFVARGLDPGAREAWDAFASDGLAAARERLGADFEATHDAAPPWRFVDGPGPFGPDWRAGALAASVDAAGRRFWLVVAGDGLDEPAAAAGGEVLAERMEGLIYDAFAHDWDVDALWRAAGDVVATAIPADGDHAQASWWTEGAAGHPPQSLAGRPADLAALMLVPAAAAGAGEPTATWGSAP